jgi:hypothetical protein
MKANGKKKNRARGILKALKWAFSAVAFSIKALLMCAAGAAIGAAIIVSEIDPNKYKDAISGQIERSIGRKARIEGDLRWRLFSLEPGIEIDGLFVENADWGLARDMLSADSAIAVVSFKHLLSKRITIDTVSIESPVVNLEISPSGEKNWIFGTSGEKEEEKSSRAPWLARKLLKGEEGPEDGPAEFSIDVKSVAVENALVRWRDLGDDSQGEATLRTMELRAAPGAPAEITAEVEYEGGTYRAGFKGFLIEDAAKNAHDFLVSGRVSLGPARADVVGKVNDVMNLKSISGSITLDIPNVEKAFENIADLGLEKPLAGEIDFVATDRFISVPRAELAYGTLELSGEAEITLGRRIGIKGEFSTPLVDIPNVFFPGWEEAYFERVRTNAELPDDDGPYIPDPKAFRDIPLPVEALDLANLNLKLSAGEVRAMPEMPIRNVEIGAVLARGEGVVAPFSFDYMDGRVELGVIANNLGGTFNGDVSVKASGVDVGKIVDSTGYRGVIKGGKSNADIVLKGSGRNLEEFMKTLSGYVKIYTTSEARGYSIDSLLMTNDVVFSAFKFLTRDVVDAVAGVKASAPQSLVQCVVANLDIAEGKTESRRGIAIQTDAANIVVDGSVDLGAEQMDVSIITVVKEGFKISNSLTEMVKIQGSMARPRIIISTDGIINTTAKTAFTTLLIGTLTGGVTLVTAGIGFVTKSWLQSIQEDRNPCLTAFEGKGELRPNENFGDQVIIKEELEGRVEEQKQELDDATTNRMNREKKRAKRKI